MVDQANLTAWFSVIDPDGIGRFGWLTRSASMSFKSLRAFQPAMNKPTLKVCNTRGIATFSCPAAPTIRAPTGTVIIPIKTLTPRARVHQSRAAIVGLRSLMTLHACADVPSDWLVFKSQTHTV